uniref:Uncharacterized protein n=1 Tax=Oryza meridionalis TaxID=40149 RepID=A0A0E0E078_9ORYZ
MQKVGTPRPQPQPTLSCTYTTALKKPQVRARSAASDSSNWSAPNATTHGLYPPAPSAFSSSAAYSTASCHGAASSHAPAPPAPLHGGGRNTGIAADTVRRSMPCHANTNTPMREAAAMVQKRPTRESARKAPMSGVMAETPPKLVRVVAALASGMCSCLVRYMSMFVVNPSTASFSATSFAACVRAKTRQISIRI